MFRLVELRRVIINEQLGALQHQQHPTAPPLPPEFLCVAQAVLELTLYTRLASNLETHLPLPSRYWD